MSVCVSVGESEAQNTVRACMRACVSSEASRPTIATNHHQFNINVDHVPFDVFRRQRRLFDRHEPLNQLQKHSTVCLW